MLQAPRIEQWSLWSFHACSYIIVHLSSVCFLGIPCALVLFEGAVSQPSTFLSSKWNQLTMNEMNAGGFKAVIHSEHLDCPPRRVLFVAAEHRAVLSVLRWMGGKRQWGRQVAVLGLLRRALPSSWGSLGLALPLLVTWGLWLLYFPEHAHWVLTPWTDSSLEEMFGIRELQDGRERDLN